MIETRATSELTRLAILTLSRIHTAELEEIAQAAAVSDAAPGAEGWTLDLSAMRWTRTVTDPPSEDC
jgi:hypothetical protein